VLRFAALVLISLALTGCSSQVGAFTLLSTHNVEVSRIDLKKMDLGRHQGTSTRFWLLCIPIGRAPSIDEAIDDCIERGRGDFVLNARVYDNSWTCLLFSWGSYVVQGEVGLSTKCGRDLDSNNYPATAPSTPQPPSLQTAPGH
jgi:hypothetical protein